MVDGIFLFQREAHVGVALKVLLMELSAPDHLLREGPLHIHEMSQHLIIGLAWEEDLAREEFIDHTADAPDVHGVICIQSATFTVHDAHGDVSMADLTEPIQG